MKNLIIIILNIFSISISAQVNYKYYQKKELEKDLTYFSDKLMSIHPLLFDKANCSKWEHNFGAMKNSLKDSMTQNEFYLLASPMLAFLNDDHSNFICPLDQRKQYMVSGLAFPFSVSLHGNSITITEYYGSDSCMFKGGEEITQINGITSSAIIKEMQKLVGGNSDAVRNAAIVLYFRTYLWITYHFEDDYEIYLKDSHNEVSKIVVKGITNEQFQKNRMRYPQLPQERYSLVLDRINKNCILKIHSFADLKSFCTYADSSFQVIEEKGIENLILDIRGNGGGRSIVVDSLMNYLTDQQYSQYKKIDIRISNDLKSYYKEKYPEKYQDIKDSPTNELVSSAEQETIPHEKKYRFKGKLFLLTDSLTFSAAATFAGLFKELNLGSIIGEETGGKIEYYGDFWYLTLPNSKLQFYISPKKFIQYGGADMKKGVMPDYLIANKSDSIIKFTYSLIEKQRNTSSKFPAKLGLGASSTGN